MILPQARDKKTDPQDIGNTHVGYRMLIEPYHARLRATFNGETIVDSKRAMVMRETRLKPVFYFPREDVRMDLLTRTDHRTYCPFKGKASYWDLLAGLNRAENGLWCYKAPYDEAMAIKGYVAFYQSAASVIPVS